MLPHSSITEWRKEIFRGSGAPLAPPKQEIEPGESTAINIYEQTCHEGDVQTQNIGKILGQNQANYTASPPRLHILCKSTNIYVTL